MFPESVEHCEYILAGKLSSPTCQQLGIPHDVKQPISFSHIELDSTRMRENDQPRKTKARLNPFSPYCMIPLPVPYGSSLFDPTCLRRRNERERDRVRCVNEGYLRLKEHLPISNKEKRMSKVDTLRCAIRYIKHLKSILKDDIDLTLNYESEVCDFKRENVLDMCNGNNSDHVQTNVEDESDSETFYSTDSGETFSESEFK
ncbi:helix loop helix domain [Mactra antiquata]